MMKCSMKSVADNATTTTITTITTTTITAAKSSLCLLTIRLTLIILLHFMLCPSFHGARGEPCAIPKPQRLESILLRLYRTHSCGDDTSTEVTLLDFLMRIFQFNYFAFTCQLNRSSTSSDSWPPDD
uniref:Uncharacterized protein n=1 Tax=Glossina austeni TaxID=7395 RepID=A0A1A9V972_GLOAU